MLHKTEPAVDYLPFKQADRQELSRNNQDERLSKLMMIDDDDGYEDDDDYVESLTLVYVTIATVRCPGATVDVGGTPK